MWRRRRDAEFSAELESHLELHIADNLRAGMAPDEARRRALVALGGVQQTRERYRETSRVAWLDALFKDVQFGIRAMRRSAGFTALAIVTLAVGIAATNTAFTIMNAILIRPLPFDEADRLVDIGLIEPARNNTSLSYADFKDWERASRSFVGMAALQTGTMNVSDDNVAPERFLGSYVSASTFKLLRTQPVLGRDFTSQDDVPGASPVVILAHRVWRDRYAGDPAILGRAIRINAQPATVIGVMSPGMEFPGNSALWQPLALVRGLVTQPRDSRTLGVFGRLADGVSASEAVQELGAIAAKIAKEFSQTNTGTRVRIERLRPGIGSPWVIVFSALMSAVGFLLLVTCANIANLLLGRAAQRSREISIRASLGATRSRIVCQLLIESLLVAAVAGLAALPLSSLALQVFLSLTDEIGRPTWMNFSMDSSVFLFLSVVVLGTGVLFGLAPALHLSRTRTSDALKESAGRTASSGKWMRRWSGALVVAEVVLTVVLLAGAVAMMRFFSAQMDVTREIDTTRVLTMSLRLPNTSYPTEQERSVFYHQLEERIAVMPNVSSIAVAGVAPFLRQNSHEVSVDGHLPAEGQRLPMVDVVNVGPRYFETIGLRLLRGRALTEDDAAAGREGVVVDRRFADRFLAHREPLGASVTVFTDRKTPRRVTVVGIVPALGESEMREVRPAVYRPFGSDTPPNMTIIAKMRSVDDPAAVATQLRGEVRALDADLPLYDVRTLDEVLSWLLWANRVFGGMFAIFAGIAVLVATVGIYGVVAYTTAQRTREIGIRLALGASRSRLWWTMMGQKVAQVAVGLALGLATAFALLGLLGGLMVGRYGQDPITLAASGGFLLLVAMFSMLWPIWRATSRNPVSALRYE